MAARLQTAAGGPRVRSPLIAIRAVFEGAQVDRERGNSAYTGGNPLDRRSAQTRGPAEVTSPPTGRNAIAFGFNWNLGFRILRSMEVHFKPEQERADFDS